MKIHRDFLVYATIGILSCGGEKSVQVTSELFDFPALINHQMEILVTRNMMLDKITVMNDKRSEVFIVPDSAFWIKEFELLLSLDINKPAIRDRYKVLTSDSGNYEFTVYNHEDKNINGIQSLTVIKNRNDQMESIIVQVNRESFLQKSSRAIRLDFEWDSKLTEPVIRSYRISGQQKMFIGKSSVFEIESKFNYSD